MDQRVWAFLAGMMTTLVVAALLWLFGWFRASRVEVAGLPTPPAQATAASLPTPSPSPTAQEVAEPPSGYRLAGVAENAGQLYAVVEQPNGQHGIFRQGEEVPGLGTVVSVGGEKAVFQTSSGKLTLWVAPAPTPTRTPTTPRPTPTRREPPARSPAAAGSTPR